MPSSLPRRAIQCSLSFPAPLANPPLTRTESHPLARAVPGEGETHGSFSHQLHTPIVASSPEPSSTKLRKPQPWLPRGRSLLAPPMLETAKPEPPRPPLSPHDLSFFLRWSCCHLASCRSFTCLPWWPTQGARSPCMSCPFCPFLLGPRC